MPSSSHSARSPQPSASRRWSLRTASSTRSGRRSARTGRTSGPRCPPSSRHGQTPIEDPPVADDHLRAPHPALQPARRLRHPTSLVARPAREQQDDLQHRQRRFRSRPRRRCSPSRSLGVGVPLGVPVATRLATGRVVFATCCTPPPRPIPDEHPAVTSWSTASPHTSFRQLLLIGCLRIV